MDLLPIEQFAAVANETFDLQIGEAGHPLTLVEVRPLPAQNAGFGLVRQPFSLMFRSGSPVVLPQRTYRLKNATMGTLGIFIVPVGRDAQGVTYQAIFN